MENREELKQKVINVIDQIRPYLEADGGNINFVELTDDNIVNVELTGACSTCAFSTITLKNGVESTLKKILPEIKEVVAVNL